MHIRESVTQSRFHQNSISVHQFKRYTVAFIFIVNIFRALLRAHFKMSLSRAQNIFIPKNINTIAITITLDGISEINTEQMTTKHSEEHFFFTSAVKKTSTNFERASRF